MKYKSIKSRKTKSSKYTNYITNKQRNKNKLEGWRNDSADLSTEYSSRGHDSFHSHSDSWPPETSYAEDLVSPCGLPGHEAHMTHTDIYAGKTLMDTYYFLKKEMKMIICIIYFTEGFCITKINYSQEL